MTGTPRRDRLIGTAESERIAGGARGDRIRGLGGKDCLFGQKGRDRIRGGAGVDLIVGGNGNDRIGAGDLEVDVVRCGRGRDFAVADPSDRLRGCERIRFRCIARCPRKPNARGTASPSVAALAAARD
jgi:hypothetical protein